MGLIDALRDPQFRRDVKTNARNLGQSASNTIASNISAPVDLIALALRKAGIPVPEPVGGSQWMTERGLTRDVPQGAPKLAGETLGLLAPLAGTKEGAAAVAKGLRQMGANAAVPNTLGKQRGVIIGEMSKTWDKEAAKKAEKMLSEGMSADDVWKKTGTYKGSDGKLRQEISDNLAKYDADALAELKSFDFDPLKNTQPLGGVLNHPRLYEAYPDIADVPVHFLPQERMKVAFGEVAFGAYSPKLDRLTISQTPPKSGYESGLLHEIQHAIQKREGFSGGTGIDASVLREDALRQYMNAPGEIEARLVQDRLKISDALKKKRLPQ